MSDPVNFRNPSPPPEDITAANTSAENKSESSVSSKKPTWTSVAKFGQASSSYSKLQSGMQKLEKLESAKVPERIPSSPPSKKAEDPPAITVARNVEGKKKSVGAAKKENSDHDDDDDDDDDGEWRKEFLPDRSKADFYCDICDAHMNSEQMWENHVQGKRHLKNLKKEPGEPLSKIKAIRQDRTPHLMRKLDKVSSPVVGLDFLSELQRCEPLLDPSYTCFLCHATCTFNTVIDHILGCKHRLAYLREVSPDDFTLVENMNLKKGALTSLAQEYAAKLEKENGRGKMEVKIEKPKMAPPPPSNRRDKRYVDDDCEDTYYNKRRHSDWRSDREGWPSDPPVPLIPQHPGRSSFSNSSSNLQAYPTHMKLDQLLQLSDIIISSESEAKTLMRIINALTQSLLQFKIRNLPPGIQDMLAKHIISGDTKSLENALGLGGSGVGSVGHVLSSMASGELSGRNSGGLAGNWNLHSSRNSPGISTRNNEVSWPGPSSRGVNSPSYPSPRWHGGMSSDGHRRGDRSTFGC